MKIKLVTSFTAALLAVFNLLHVLKMHFFGDSACDILIIDVIHFLKDILDIVYITYKEYINIHKQYSSQS